jgi:hypothetical protein
VAGRDRRDVAGPQLDLGAVVHDHPHPARDDVEEVRELARIGAGDRLDVIAPAPAGLEHRLADLLARHRHEPQLAVRLERSRIVRLVEVLDLDRGRAAGHLVS